MEAGRRALLRYAWEDPFHERLLRKKAAIVGVLCRVVLTPDDDVYLGNLGDVDSSRVARGTDQGVSMGMARCYRFVDGYGYIAACSEKNEEVNEMLGSEVARSLELCPELEASMEDGTAHRGRAASKEKEYDEEDEAEGRGRVDEDQADEAEGETFRIVSAGGNLRLGDKLAPPAGAPELGGMRLVEHKGEVDRCDLSNLIAAESAFRDLQTVGLSVEFSYLDKMRDQESHGGGGSLSSGEKARCSGVSRTATSLMICPALMNQVGADTDLEGGSLRNLTKAREARAALT